MNQTIEWSMTYLNLPSKNNHGQFEGPLFSLTFRLTSGQIRFQFLSTWASQNGDFIGLPKFSKFSLLIVFTVLGSCLIFFGLFS